MSRGGGVGGLWFKTSPHPVFFLDLIHPEPLDRRCPLSPGFMPKHPEQELPRAEGDVQTRH